MGYTITYTGGKPYIEYNVNGIRMGFARGSPRTDLPEAWVEERILSAIDAGSTAWTVVSDAEEKKTAAMKEVVEAPKAEEPAEDLSSLTRAKLMALCKERGIETSNSDKKADLLAKLGA
jgi:hypothetical protein